MESHHRECRERRGRNLIRYLSTLFLFHPTFSSQGEMWGGKTEHVPLCQRREKGSGSHTASVLCPTIGCVISRHQKCDDERGGAVCCEPLFGLVWRLCRHTRLKKNSMEGRCPSIPSHLNGHRCAQMSTRKPSNKSNR